MGAIGTEIQEGESLIGCALFTREHIAPAAVGAFVDERLGAAVIYGTTERRGLGCVRLHVLETAMLKDCLPPILVDRDGQEVGDASDLARHVRLERRIV